VKKVLKALLDVFMYVAIVGGLIWGLPIGLSWALDTPYPMASITSGSMWPVLKERDLIFIQGVGREELKVGDIIVWENNKGFTIHRIVKLNEKTFVTKGDANFKEDKPVTYDKIVGRTFKVGDKIVRLPYIGFITIAASKYYTE